MTELHYEIIKVLKMDVDKSWNGFFNSMQEHSNTFSKFSDYTDCLNEMQGLKLVEIKDDYRLYVTQKGNLFYSKEKANKWKQKWKGRVSLAKDTLNIVVFLITIITAVITAIAAMQSIGNNQKRIKELEKAAQQLQQQVRLLQPQHQKR